MATLLPPPKRVKVYHGVPELIFYGGALTSEVEEARHEQTMPNEERAEPIELGLRGRERDFDRSALFLSR
jgi:hypothetical protein